MKDKLKYLINITYDNDQFQDLILSRVSNIYHIDKTCILFNIDDNTDNYLKYCFKNKTHNHKISSDSTIGKMIKRGIGHHYKLRGLDHVQNITSPDNYFGIEGLIGELQYIKGKNLNYQENDSMDQDLILKQFKSLEETINLFHENEIIHGDIKPGNIIETPDGEVYFIDFSTAISFKEDFIDRKEGTIFGTLKYFSVDESRSRDFVALGLTMAGVVLKNSYNWGNFPNKLNLPKIIYEIKTRIKKEGLYESADFFEHLMNKSPEYDTDNLFKGINENIHEVINSNIEASKTLILSNKHNLYDLLDSSDALFI